VSGPPRFGAEELGATEGKELDHALDAIVALEAVADGLTVRVDPAFTDRVMAALAHEPSPMPVGFLAPLRRRGLLAGFAESVRQAWASIRAGRPAFARAAALAYVLVVVLAGTSLAGAATIGAAGALGWFAPRETVSPSPEPTLPLSTTPSTEPMPSPEPTESAEPAETETPEPSDDRGGGGAEPSDDHGGGAAEPSDDKGGSGGGSDDRSGGSGGSGPSSTDDHSGSDDGSGSGSGSGSDD
jgi:hypothetical protein